MNKRRLGQQIAPFLMEGKAFLFKHATRGFLRAQMGNDKLHLSLHSCAYRTRAGS